MQITITEQEYQELMRIKREYEKINNRIGVGGITKMKEQVSVDRWSEGEEIKYLQKHIDENFSPLIDDALDSLAKKYERLKRLDDNVKNYIKEVAYELDNFCQCTECERAFDIYTNLKEKLESLDK